MPDTIFARSPVLTSTSTHYCPGCTHGVIHRMVAEVVDELGIRARTVGIAPVGCAVLAYNYFGLDFQEASHGRAPAVATAWNLLSTLAGLNCSRIAISSCRWRAMRS